jgi:hypothetical protein
MPETGSAWDDSSDPNMPETFNLAGDCFKSHGMFGSDDGPFSFADFGLTNPILKRGLCELTSIIIWSFKQ